MTEAEWRRFAQAGGLEQFTSAAERARQAQAAINALGAGPPGTQPQRACSWSECGKVLSAHAGFIEVISQPDGTREDFCSKDCLHWQLHEDLRQ